MIKKNVILASISTLLTGLLIVTNAVAAVVFDAARATIPAFTIEPSFVFTDGSGTYNCYTTTGGVSIAWGLDPEDAPDGTLNVPAEVTDDASNKYKVVSIMHHGFRYCDSTSIKLPDTIVEIGNEAFAFCENLSTFILPSLVTSIPDSCFSDCRSLRNFYYSDGDGIDNTGHPKYDGETGYLIYGGPLVVSNGLSSIGDHAFSSCVSLMTFNCPSTLISIGDCAFQNCDSFSRIFLPSLVDENTDGTADNQLSIGKYAFANCKDLVWVYFERNLISVDKYAFVDCHEDMVLHYGCEGNYPGDSTVDSWFTSNWRKEYIENKSHSTDGKIPIETDYIQIYQSDNYPGLRYTITNSDIYMDGTTKTGNKRPKIYKASDNNNEDYAVIYEWYAPSVTVPNYYNVGTQALEIPGKLTLNGKNYDLKVIKSETFRNHNDISSVKFNSGLIQICNRAFYNTPNIASLDFSDCDTLIEISNGIFNDYQSQTANTLISTLSLPNSVQYVGRYAFYNFSNCSHVDFKANDDGPGDLKVLGGYAFGRIGFGYNEGVVEVTLPCSLNDAAANTAQLNKQETTGAPAGSVEDGIYNETANYNDYNNYNKAAIGPYAFGGGFSGHFSCVKSVVMEKCEHTDENGIPTTHASAAECVADNCQHSHVFDNTYTCSLAGNAFNRAIYLTRFEANENLCYIGTEAFKNCKELREVFLTSRKALVKAGSGEIPWGSKAGAPKTYEQSIFYGTSSDYNAQHLVVYVDGNIPSTEPTSGGQFSQYVWNGDGGRAYQIDLGYNNGTGGFGKQNDTALSRSTVPTYENVNFLNDQENILYWSPSNQNWLTQKPTAKADYDAGVITFIRNNANNPSATPTYSVGKYYCSDSELDQNDNPIKNSVDEIDLTGNTFTTPASITSPGGRNISNNLTEIGPEAFAHHGAEAHGLYFILPHSIKNIRERAFLRRAAEKDESLGYSATRIITYVASGESTPKPKSSGVDNTYSAIKNDCENKESDANNLKAMKGYCLLPPNIERIEKDAFYCNKFDSVEFSDASHLSFLGNNAFYSYTKSDKTYNRSVLSSITFGSNNNSYFDYQNEGLYFKGSSGKRTLLYQTQNSANTSLTIYSGTKAIGLGACASTSYETITFNSELTHIYGCAFQNNVKLTTVIPNAGLKYICGVDTTSEIYDDSVDDYFDNVDFRQMIDGGNFARLNSRTSAFAGCANLETFNFDKLENIVKIGHAAFKGCSKLKNLVSAGSYTFYNIKNGSPVEKTGTDDYTNAKNGIGVLDLSNCVETLTSIGKECFYDCGLIKFIIIPKPSDSHTLYIGKDNDGQCTSGAAQIINKNIPCLLGYTANEAWTDSSVSEAYNHKDVWNTKFINNNSGNIYYYASSDADVFTDGTSSSVKYWTMHNGGYLLFENRTDALAYLP